MADVITEQRRSPRAPAAFLAGVFDGRGHLLARGRTTDISETGVHVVVQGRPLAGRSEVVLELAIPGVAPNHARRGVLRKVRYRCRVVRTEPVAQMMGLGLEFLAKLQ